MDTQPELFVGRYRIIRQIGAGGMGVVFEAEDQLLNNTVAIKTIKKGIFSGEHIMRFDREAKALAALNHPNLVALYVFGVTDDNEPYMVMRLESGVPLSELIEKERIPLKKAIQILIQICQAMQHAHDRSVLHRDLKPSNILVRDLDTDRPNAVVIDFGVAMVDQGSAIDSLTKTGMFVGTPAFMSPEQVKGQEIDCRSDIYSLGCIMFQALTGLTPFTAPSTLEVLGRKISKRAPSINSAVPGLTYSTRLEEIVQKCLELSASDRYSSMLELKNDLEHLGERETAEMQTTSANSILSSKRIRQVILIAILILLPMSFALLMFGEQPRTVVSQSEPKREVERIQSKPLSEDLALHFDDDSTSQRGSYVFIDHKPIRLSSIGAESTALDLVQNYSRDRPPRSLKFRNSAITGKLFEKCKNLPIVRLDIVGCSIDDAGIRSLSGLQQLESLEISSNAEVIAPAALRSLKDLTNLKVLKIDDCNFDASHVVELAKLNHLEHLDLSNNPRLDDDCTETLSKMSNLIGLAVNNTHISGDGLKKIVKNKRLKALSLKGLIIGDNDALSLVKLKLESLNVEATAITDKGLEALGKIKTLKQLFPAPQNWKPRV